MGSSHPCDRTHCYFGGLRNTECQFSDYHGGHAYKWFVVDIECCLLFLVSFGYVCEMVRRSLRNRNSDYGADCTYVDFATYFEAG
ncbi:hypothetical protein D3C81_2013950 [compost metagenome]